MKGLVLDNVWFAYRGSRWVVRGVSMAFEPCRAYFITGPNGAGKTTLLRLAGLLARPQHGRVLVDGVDYWSSPSLQARRAVVYVSSRPLLVRGSLLWNLALGLVLRGVDRSEALRRARTLLERVGLESLAGVDAREASMGQAQLIHVLRGLLVKPRYLLLDEPTAYLDSEKRMLLANLLHEALEECTSVIIAGHDVELASMISAEVYEMVEGVVRLRWGALSASR